MVVEDVDTCWSIDFIALCDWTISNGDNRLELPGSCWERNVKTVPSDGIAARCGCSSVQDNSQHIDRNSHCDEEDVTSFQCDQNISHRDSDSYSQSHN